MPVDEQKRRMARMKAQVTENNVYRWAADLIGEMIHSAEENPNEKRKTHDGAVTF